MLTAARIFVNAKQDAKARGFDEQALDLVNLVLSDLCQTTDVALARGKYEFDFDPSLTTLFGSGPYPLPLDYLRTSGTSGARGSVRPVTYLYPAPTFPQGQPMFLTPIDLGEFDLFPQIDSQSMPQLWATDMGGPLTDRIVLATAMATTVNSTTGTPVSLTGLRAGLGVAGQGIEPGTTIVSVGATTIVMSIAATATNTAASVFFGIAPVAYVYPAPQGTWPVTLRYQRMMPPLLDTAQYPWFPMDGYMTDKLAARLMKLTGDDRQTTRDQQADMELRRYLSLSDDKTNRSQAVQLDGRNYGHAALGGRNLRNTKTAGW